MKRENCRLAYRIADYFRGGNISQMPSGAIIHEENFHKCMALNNTATLNLANFHGLISICEIREIFPL